MPTTGFTPRSKPVSRYVTPPGAKERITAKKAGCSPDEEYSPLANICIKKTITAVKRREHTKELIDRYEQQLGGKWTEDPALAVYDLVYNTKDAVVYMNSISHNRLVVVDETIQSKKWPYEKKRVGMIQREMFKPREDDWEGYQTDLFKDVQTAVRNVAHPFSAEKMRDDAAFGFMGYDVYRLDCIKADDTVETVNIWALDAKEANWRALRRVTGCKGTRNIQKLFAPPVTEEIL